MDAATIVILLMLAVMVFALLASKIGIPYPTMMVIGGLVICFIPPLQKHFRIDPGLIFTIFLPPLLYGGAWQLSWKEFWGSRRAIFLLAVGLVFFTTAGVAGLAITFIPGFTLATAFVLGAVVSPPDALAVTVIAKRLHLPRKLVGLLEGESLVNDASALVALKFALEAASTGQFSLVKATGEFVLVAAGGVFLGLVLGWLVCAIHKRLRDPLIEITLTFLTPYAAYLLGEHVGVSGVLATVTAGLYVSWQAPVIMKPEVRIEATAVWNFVQFMLNGFVFVFVGLLLPSVLHALQVVPDMTTGRLLFFGLLVSGGVVALRMAWVVPGTFLPWMLMRKVRWTEQRPSMRRAMLVGWTGMRGVVTLAAALALPEVLTVNGEPILDSAGNPVPFPNRGMIIFLAFFVILITLVAQSLTLPGVVKLLKVRSADDEAAEEREARLYAARAALVFIRDLTEATDAFGSTGTEIRGDYERRIARLESPVALPIELIGIDTSDMDVYREAISIERQAVVEMRANQKISIEIYQRLMSEIDAAEVRLPGRR